MLQLLPLHSLNLAFFCLGTFVGTALYAGGEPPQSYYQESTWKPRAILPAADALKGGFWPASPKIETDYNDAGFDSTRLSKVPAPGIHPRVLVSPEDVLAIRAKVELGDKAPLEFRTMWERLKKSRSAFYALVAQDDDLGRELTADLVRKIKSLEPKLDMLDQRPEHDNLWCLEKSIAASGDPNPPIEIWSLLDYDYLHGWMTPEERESARRVIARVTAGRISNFMMVPDHFMINNHEGFGMEFIRLILLIEGEKGFDSQIYDLAAQKTRAMLDWYLSKDGMAFESIKGWLNTSAFVAVGRRQRDLLKHSHLRAKMGFFQAALHWEADQWQIRDEMRASAFHVIWMMHHYHPKDEGLDLLYSASLTTHPFLTDPNAKWPNPVGISPELLVLFADGVMNGPEGRPIDWNLQKNIDRLHLPITWKDDVRGYVYTRNSSRKEDVQLGFTCKQDFFYGGHEGSENNRFILWRDGVNWVRDLNMLAVKATFLQNMLTIDGKGLNWPPAPGVWLGVQETPGGLVAAGDGKMGYSYAKRMQVHPLDFPSAQLPYYAPFAEGNYDLTRDLQVAFHPGTVKWNDGYAHTDYGPWSGETRLVEDYRIANPMEQAYRTVFLARGEHPYVLVIDDARKDGASHLFEWNISLPEGVDLVDAKTPEVAFQLVEPREGREGDLLLTAQCKPRDPNTGKLPVAKGDPLFLVRTLWRNSPNGFPVPRLERFNGTPELPFRGFSHLTIPAISESPEFRVLLYPHKAGDPLPVTAWNKNHTELTVQIKDQRDVYHFGQTDGGRTIFSMDRDGKPVIGSNALPARPVLDVRGQRFDINELRTTRNENQIPEYKFGHEMRVGLVRPPAPAFIRYSLDGTDPGPESPVYLAPLLVRQNTELRARIVDPNWPSPRKVGSVLNARFVQVQPAKGSVAPPANSQPGLLARVYEKKTVLWDNRGFFDASRIMLPDLSKESPMLAIRASGFELPQVAPSRPMKEQTKGFYRFTGYFKAAVPGTYEFAVDSCGPVQLVLSGQTAIASAGVFHQQQQIRRGEVVLDAGWHPIDLVVCDPLFWNISTAKQMPFAVTVRHDGGTGAPVSELCFQPAGEALSPAPTIPSKNAQTPPQWMEPGAMLSVFDREGKNGEPGYLDLEGLTPLRREPAEEFKTNLRSSRVLDYEGWFQAPEDGVYEFDLPGRRVESAGLGEMRSAYQNQLRIDDEVVVQRGIGGRLALAKIELKSGWHTFSLRLGSSPGSAMVTYPDGQSLPLTAALISRPVQVDIRPQGNKERVGSHVEIFVPTAFTFTLPADRHGEIHYTTNGRSPSANDPIYKDLVLVQSDEILTASVFLDGKEVTAPCAVQVKRVKVPQAERIAGAVFANWNGVAGDTTLDPLALLSITPGAKLVNDGSRKVLSFNSGLGDGVNKMPQAVDQNLALARSQANFKVSRLKMMDNALTVGLWFNSSTASGKLFGKDGFNAFGKSYKTVSCSVVNGQLQAAPGQIAGGKIKPDRWQQVVLTGDENAVLIYLNGELVAKGSGCSTLNTDSFDFCSQHPASVDRFAIYNRVIAPDDVKHWFLSEQQEIIKEKR